MTIEDTASAAVDHGRERQKAQTRALLIEMAALPADDPARARLRDEVVSLNLPLARHLARRFDGRGEPLDDLQQVAVVGLIKSIDRFEPERGLELSTFATPTILGELKRHFRDRTWSVRVPRRLQDLGIGINRVSAAMTHELGRAPTVPELATALEVSEDDIIDALESAAAYSTVPLDAPIGEGTTIVDTLAVDDTRLDAINDQETVRPLLDALAPRERRIIMLRFFENQTQSQIADDLGISQMHVSRLLARTLRQLRDSMNES